MSYTKTAWVDDTAPAVDAVNLNKIEQGIYDAHQLIAAFQGTISGATFIWPFETLPSSDYLWADGAAVARAAYPALHNYCKNVGGTNAYGWGPGDGTTTFNVPKLSHRIPIGKGTHVDINALAKTEGETNLSKLTPIHGHTIVDPGHRHQSDQAPIPFVIYTNGGSDDSGGDGTSLELSPYTGYATTGITVGPQDRLLDRIPFVVVNFIVKT